MRDSKRDADVKNCLLDSVGEGEGGMILEGSVETCILSYVKQQNGKDQEIRDTKGTFYAKMGSIKDRNDRDLTEAEDIKKRWQEYTEELYKKDLHAPK